MPLDPILSLSVAVAEAPGSYAVFLGSGVSRDAGVPTGGEVFWRAVGELWRLECGETDTPERPGLTDWLAETGRADLGYSALLELIAPDPATRRDYLAKHFEGVPPGPTHERLAALATQGLVTVFVTTNFDRLLEHALQARGLEPVVITSAADLEVAPAREHARCYVLKPHGDYLQQSIRNTPAELAELEPALSAELQEILDRYGVIVLGYSGSDEAVAAAFRARRGRYGVYWVSRGELAGAARPLVEAVGGRVIVRPGAAEFLADFERRLAVFVEHPSGQTPAAITDEMLLSLRRNDEVGARELLRDGQRDLEERVRDITEGRRNQQPTPAVAEELRDGLRPALEARLAGLLPLLQYRPALLVDEARRLADFKARAPRFDGFTFWAGVPTYCVRWLGWALGTYAARQWLLPPLRPLLTATLDDRHGQREPLVPSMPGDIALGIGEALNLNRSPQYIAAWWEAMRLEFAQLSLFKERYPELLVDEDALRRSMVSFDLLLSLACRLRGHSALAAWTIYSSDGQDFAARLRGDPSLRADAAEAVGLTLDEFDAQAPAALRDMRHLDNGFGPDLRTVAVLEGTDEGG